MSEERYYGKYRGTVIMNVDPLFKGRIRALVPSLTEFIPTTWVEPCSPFAGPASGFCFVPPLASKVWIEFVEGMIQFPIYTGGYWDETDLALIPPQSKPFIVPGESTITTMTGATITFNMTPPGITIQTIDMKKISINPTGIEISLGTPSVGIVIDAAGNVRITSPTTVSVNAPKVSINSP